MIFFDQIDVSQGRRHAYQAIKFWIIECRQYAGDAIGLFGVLDWRSVKGGAAVLLRYRMGVQGDAGHRLSCLAKYGFRADDHSRSLGCRPACNP